MNARQRFLTNLILFSVHTSAGRRAQTRDCSQYSLQPSVHALCLQELEETHSPQEAQSLQKANYLCNRPLKIRYDNQDHSWPLIGVVTYKNWQELEFMTLRESHNCTTRYVAKCRSGAIESITFCGSAPQVHNVETDYFEYHSLFGLPLPHPLTTFQHDANEHGMTIFLAEGEILRGPMDASVTLNGGYMRLSVEGPLTWDLFSGYLSVPWQLSQKAVRNIASWIQKAPGVEHQNIYTMAHKTAQSILSKPDDIMTFLQDYAANMRIHFDAVQPEPSTQTFYHLLQLLIQAHLSLEYTLSSRVSALSEDMLLITKLARMSAKEFEGSNVKQLEISRLKLFVAYYRGLAKHPATTGSSLEGKRALIFSCAFGNGHKYAAKAVTSFLKAEGMDVTTVDTTEEPDFRGFGQILGEYTYNEVVLKHKLYSLHNMLDLWERAGGPLYKPCVAPQCNYARKDAMRARILDYNADIVVTVYHMELLPILEVAKDLGNLPVLHIATDMDIKMREVFGDAGPGPLYPRFRVGVPFPVQRSLSSVAPAAHPTQDVLTGYAVRNTFIGRPNESEIASLKGIYPEHTKLMLVMGGGDGGSGVPDGVVALSRQGIGQPLHIIMVAGTNNELEGLAQSHFTGRATFPDGQGSSREVMYNRNGDPSVTIEVPIDPHNPDAEHRYKHGGVRLAAMMDLAHVILTKPGGATTAEVAYRGTPAMFDCRNELFHWERFNVDVFVDMGRGVAITEAVPVQKALVQAMSINRSQVMVMDPKSTDGAILQPSIEIPKTVRYLLGSTSCRGCTVLP